jgi:hypothetical protein
MKTWNELKQNGSEHYKTGGIEPVDLYSAGNMFHDFALCSIMKYAFRSRREMKLDKQLMIKNLEKIIDYAQKLIAKQKADPEKNLFEKHKKPSKHYRPISDNVGNPIFNQFQDIVTNGHADE